MVELQAALFELPTQRHEFGFEARHGFAMLCPQAYRHARYAKLDLTLYGAERRRIDGKADRPHPLRLGGTRLSFFDAKLQHVVAAHACQRNLDHPEAGLRMRLQLADLDAGERRAHVAAQLADELIDVIFGHREFGERGGAWLGY